MFESGNTVNPIPIKYDWFIQVQLISQLNLLDNHTSKTSLDEVILLPQNKNLLLYKMIQLFFEPVFSQIFNNLYLAVSK